MERQLASNENSESQSEKIKKYIDFLYNLNIDLFGSLGSNREIDIRPYAQKKGLDIDDLMSEIIQINTTCKYNVGGHMLCTANNVLPQYKAKGEITVDRDHLEGLYQILRVGYGFRKDY